MIEDRADRSLSRRRKKPSEATGADALLTYPLSAAQERLWFIERLHPGTALHNICLAIRYAGPVDVDRLRASLDVLRERHGSLRTRFVVEDGEPRQLVDPPAPQPLEVVDLRAQDGAGAQALLERSARRPFVLDVEHPLRALAVRSADDELLLALTLHHLVTDGWSNALLLDELGSVYAALEASAPPPLTPLSTSYAELALAERRGGAQLLEKDMDYWRKLFQDPPARLELPVDRSWSAARPGVGASTTVQLKDALVERLREAARRRRTSLSATLLTAYAVLLARWTGEGDLVIGTLFSGRLAPEARAQVGFFVNTLPLRIDAHDDPTFDELHTRVKRAQVNAFRHQRVRFETLVSDLRVDRVAGRMPLFDAMFVYNNAVPHAPTLGAARGQLVPVELGTAQVALSLLVHDAEDGVELVLEHGEAFEPETIEAFLEQYQALLHAVAADVDGQRISALPLMDRNARRRVLEDGNRTDAPVPEGTLDALFEAQATRTPDAVAIVSGDCSITYAQLDALAERIAARLLAVGVGVESLVGICVERSWEMVAAMLGVLKAGAAYVPLDPEYPPDRLSLMLEDAGVAAVISERRVAHVLPPSDRTLTLLDGDATHDPLPAAAATRPRARPESLAYVIYTSGSSGRPKGVAIEHRAVVNFLAAMLDQLTWSKDVGVLAVTTLSFDIAVLELIGPLLAGGRVVLADAATARTPELLAAGLARPDVTAMQATPLAWRLAIAGGWSGGADVLCGGEALSPDLAHELIARAGCVRNLYGPTETTIWSTCARVARADGRTVPIGRPIANTRTYVVGDDAEPVAVGELGELWIGGAGVARGYLGDPARTAARFVPDPFGPPGRRLYRTGDLVRRRADGSLEFHGRRDDQVKVRGFRIELGEIETALRMLPGARDAAVAVERDAAAGDRLLAYVAGDPSELPDEATARAMLAARLPEHMLPATIACVERLPSTPNGKVNRRALVSTPTASLRRDATNCVAVAGTPLERSIAAVFSELLQLDAADELGADESFFDRGMHSMLIVHAAERLEAALARPVPLVALYDHPTVRALAMSLEDATAPE